MPPLYLVVEAIFCSPIQYGFINCLKHVFCAKKGALIYNLLSNKTDKNINTIKQSEKSVKVSQT